VPYLTCCCKDDTGSRGNHAKTLGNKVCAARRCFSRERPVIPGHAGFRGHRHLFRFRIRRVSEGASAAPESPSDASPDPTTNASTTVPIVRLSGRGVASGRICEPPCPVPSVLRAQLYADLRWAPRRPPSVRPRFHPRLTSSSAGARCRPQNPNPGPVAGGPTL
jgi:hypothetical protein